MRELKAKPVEGWTKQTWRAIRTLLRLPHSLAPVFETIAPESMLPSFKEEVQSLRNKLDQTSPIQCFMMSRLHGLGNRDAVSDEEKEWYRKGLEATRIKAEENPDIVITIIE